jgi:hypothetical protein
MFFEETVLSPVHVFGAFVENHLALAVQVYLWDLILLCLLLCFGDCDYKVTVLKSSIVMPPALFFLLNCCGYLCFHMNFRIVLVL